MKRSDPWRNTIARKPSHFGSYRNPPPSGNASASLASMGSTGGAMANAGDELNDSSMETVVVIGWLGSSYRPVKLLYCRAIPALSTHT